MHDGTFREAVEQHHRALAAFMASDTEPFKAMFSQRDDATLANPFGGVARGWAEIPQRLDRAASYYADGELVAIETISSYSSGDLGYTLEIERLRARVGGLQQVDQVALRTSSVLRREDGVWKLVHRHADPRVDLQAPESVVAEDSAA